MPKVAFPIYIVMTPAAAAIVGREAELVVGLALRAVLLNRRGIEVAHQQIEWRGRQLAFSCRITLKGDLAVDLDAGLPGLAGRIVLEEDLRRSERASRGRSDPPQRWR